MTTNHQDKHTAGPWTVCEHSWSHTGIYAKHIGVASLDISSEADEEDMQDEWQGVMAANARLIAAAPDLLSALRSLAEVYDAMGAPRGPARIMADAAIERAIGVKP
jgi:hypothetical protein